ncbi:hypothetical protein HanRHA438_Chr03g0125391 [Helianthus annuus]|nr:hypothetical protein HanRHA438_Chr03g0125391 [Helianthus annuus]
MFPSIFFIALLLFSKIYGYYLHGCLKCCSMVKKWQKEHKDYNHFLMLPHRETLLFRTISRSTWCKSR